MNKSFSNIFDSNEKLKTLSGADRMKLMNIVYDKLGQSPNTNPAQMRAFRDAQEQTMYEYDMANTENLKGLSLEDWRSVHESGYKASERGANIMGGMAHLRKRIDVDPVRKEQYDAFKSKDTSADWSDFATAATAWDTYPARLAKAGSDLFALAEGLSGTARSAFHAVATGQMPRNWFSTEYATSPTAQAVNKDYKEAIKSDPEMMKLIDTLVVDTAISLPFGFGSLGAAKKAATATGQTLGRMAKAREFLAPVASNVLGGQVIYQTVENMDELFKDTTMSESEKNAWKLAGMLGIGLISGFTLEPVIEKAIKTSAKASPAVQKVAQVVEQTGGDVPSLKQAILDDPSLDDSLKEMLGIKDDPQLSTKFGADSMAQALDAVPVARAKADAGQPLDTNEAQALKEFAGPEDVTDTFLPDDVWAEVNGLVNPSRAVEPLSALDLARSATGEFTLSPAIIAQRGIASIDKLTQQGRLLKTECGGR